MVNFKELGVGGVLALGIVEFRLGRLPLPGGGFLSLF